MALLLTLSLPTSFFYRIEFVIFRTAISDPANIYLFKVNNRKTRKRCEICSKLTMKIPERRPDVVLVFLLLILNIFHAFFLFFYWWLWTSKCFLGNNSKFLIGGLFHIRVIMFTVIVKCGDLLKAVSLLLIFNNIVFTSVCTLLQ